MVEICEGLAQTRHYHQRNTSNYPCQQIVLSANFDAACPIADAAVVV